MREIVVTENPNHLKSEISFEERQQQLDEQTAREELEQKKVRNSPYKDFCQTNNKYNTVRAKLILKNAPAAAIFQFLSGHIDHYNAVVCSYTVIQEALSISRASIQRGIAYLKENGYITVAKSGTTNVYVLNPQLVWNSWGTNYKYCEFDAKVILSATENEDLIKSKKQKTVVIKEQDKEN